MEREGEKKRSGKYRRRQYVGCPEGKKDKRKKEDKAYILLLKKYVHARIHKCVYVYTHIYVYIQVLST